MQTNKRMNLAVATVGWLMGGTAAFAHGPAPEINQLVDASSMVVQSRVAKVDYRMAPSGQAGQPDLPYTVVTYNIVKVIQGNATTKSLTLRFVGGPDGRGGFLEASNVPIFQVGDEDIMFVQGSGANGCALAGCINGRFRVLRGAVYDGNGAPVQGIVGNKVMAQGSVPVEFRTVKYPAPDFDQLMKNPQAAAALRQQGMSIETARQRYKAEAPAYVEVQTFEEGRNPVDSAQRGATPNVTPEQVAVPRPLALDRFLASITAVGPSAKAQSNVVPNFDTHATIPMPSGTAAPPPAAPPQSDPKQLKGDKNLLPAVQKTPQDLAEESLLPKDDFSSTRNKAQ